MAADMPPGAPPLAAPPIYGVFDWNGFYVGPNVGYGFANPTATATTLGASATASQKLDEALAGGQLGVNWQTGSIVWGLEADIDWSGQHTTTTWFGTPVVDRLLSRDRAQLRELLAVPRADRAAGRGAGGARQGRRQSGLTHNDRL
jgi:outer membrane immunogenic protein